jgi:hypothetical protein
MTLVVTEASAFGIAMVGDSALTVSEVGHPQRILAGAAKVQYAPLANVGFAVWGDACVGSSLIDAWLTDFIQAHDRAGTDIESMGLALEGALRVALASDARAWNKKRRGIHLAGFVGGIPHIYHLHTGHDLKNQHQPTLYRDYPYGIGATPQQFMQLAARTPQHLRNGYYQHFAGVYQSFKVYADLLPQIGVDWPGPSLDDRCAFLTLQAQVVALTLQWSGRQQKVNTDVSAIAFTPTGLTIDRRLTPSLAGVCGSAAELAF